MAINRAIAVPHLRDHISVWVAWDDPQILLREVLQAPRVPVWGKEKHRQGWADLGYRDFTAIPNGWIVVEREGEENVTMRCTPTVIMAMDYARSLGANHFRIFGVDMLGKCTGGEPIEAWSPEEGEVERNRWAIERDGWEQYLVNLAHDGVKIEMVQPKESKAA